MTKKKEKSRHLLCNKTLETMMAVVVTFFVATPIEKKGDGSKLAIITLFITTKIE
jgi:hypothetical protein